jgi:hypothetical protein
MRSIILAACAAFFVSGTAVAQTDQLDGAWRGAYISDNGVDINTFDVTFDQSGTTLNGTVLEVNIMGDSKTLFLTSTLAGKREGARVRFTKTYDGSGGVSHSVAYEGMIDATGRRIVGTYDAGGSGGEFEIAR